MKRSKFKARRPSSASSTPQKITPAQYVRKVKELAREVLRERRKARGDLDFVDEALNDTIDGYAWITETWALPFVLMHSEHHNAAFERGALKAENYFQITQTMAFYAMRADVAAVVFAKLPAKLQEAAKRAA
jgi:hypothetical protein